VCWMEVVTCEFQCIRYKRSKGNFAIIVPMTVDTVRTVLLMMGVCTARNM